VQCVARERCFHTFNIYNFTKNDCTFEVESDLVHVSGNPTIFVSCGDSSKYELAFLPLQAGIVTGCIMFKDP
jgi:hypothetical protein